MNDTNEKPKLGWGGARKGAGGARVGAGGSRSGAGRPRKINLAPSRFEYADPKPGKNTPRGPIVSRMVTTPDGKRIAGISTGGSLDQYVRAWVYVGVRKDGLVKIGMSGNVPQRCRQLRIALFFAHPVVPGLAKTLESMALRRLGSMKCGSEWVACKPETAAAAVVAARTELSRLCHADPNETPTEAFNRRKECAA